MLYSAFIFGLLGSFHCIGMCGPIAFLLPLDRQNKFKRLVQVFLYHLGRITSYAIMGFAFGLVGKSLSLFGLQQQLSLIIGVLMLIVVLFPFQKKGTNKLTRAWYRLVGGLKSSLGKELKKKRADTYFTVGFLNGFLPCGLVYMAIFGAIAGGTAAWGSVYMVLFGLGTVPLMTSAVYLGNFVSAKARQYINRAVPFIVALFAVLFIIRGLGLGIPYLSPQLEITEVSSRIKCHPGNQINISNNN